VVNSIKLFKIATEENNTRIIFISSMSAYDGCKSTYGRQKLEVEAITLAMGGIVLRPGLIWGGRCTGGMFYTLIGLVDKLPVIPMIGSGNKSLYLSHIEDLADLVCRVVINSGQFNSYLLTASSPQSSSLKKILQQCADFRGKSPLLISFPAIIIILTLKILEVIGIPIRMRSDSVIGFIYADKQPIFNHEFYRTIGFTGFREFKLC
jgi:nucleoside-diphosphate-sugar epimerase